MIRLSKEFENSRYYRELSTRNNAKITQFERATDLSDEYLPAETSQLDAQGETTDTPPTQGTAAV